MMRKAYTFDDVALVPQFNNVPSRTEPSMDSWLTKTLKMGCPLIASNMDSVICEELADILLSYGSIPIYHRFTSLEKQIQWVEKYKEKTFISCGIQKLDDTFTLLEKGAAGVCVDVAHGHSDRMMNFISEIKKRFPQKQVIALQFFNASCSSIRHAAADSSQELIDELCTRTGNRRPEIDTFSYSLVLQAAVIIILEIFAGLSSIFCFQSRFSFGRGSLKSCTFFC